MNRLLESDRQKFKFRDMRQNIQDPDDINSINSYDNFFIGLKYNLIHKLKICSEKYFENKETDIKVI